MEKFVAEIHRSLIAMPRKNVPSFRIVRREWSKRLGDYPGADITALAKQLVPLGLWERGFAYEIITHHQSAMEALTRKDVALLGRGMQSWANSSKRWWRRAALVSTVQSFLERYDQLLPPRAKREARNKLRTGLKNPRRESAPQADMPGRTAQRTRRSGSTTKHIFRKRLSAARFTQSSGRAS